MTRSDKLAMIMKAGDKGVSEALIKKDSVFYDADIHMLYDMGAVKKQWDGKLAQNRLVANASVVKPNFSK